MNNMENDYYEKYIQNTMLALLTALMLTMSAGIQAMMVPTLWTHLTVEPIKDDGLTNSEETKTTERT